MIYFIIYIIGCVLSYLRMFASFYGIDEEFIKYLPPTGVKKRHMVIITLFSWIGFFGGTFVYFIEEERYFLKYSNKKLKDLWNNTINN